MLCEYYITFDYVDSRLWQTASTSINAGQPHYVQELVFNYVINYLKYNSNAQNFAQLKHTLKLQHVLCIVQIKTHFCVLTSF